MSLFLTLLIVFVLLRLWLLAWRRFPSLRVPLNWVGATLCLATLGWLVWLATHHGS